MAPSVVPLGGSEIFRRKSLARGHPVIGGMPLKGIVGSPTLSPFSLCFFCVCPGHVVSGFAMPLAPTMMYCPPPIQGPKVMFALPWTRTSKTVSQDKLYLLINGLS
jgi:hypothetical protein